MTFIIKDKWHNHAKVGQGSLIPRLSPCPDKIYCSSGRGESLGTSLGLGWARSIITEQILNNPKHSTYKHTTYGCVKVAVGCS